MASKLTERISLGSPNGGDSGSHREKNLRSPSAELLRTVVLTNTRQSGRFESFVPDQAPDPRKVYCYLLKHGVQQILRDRLNFPVNPLARQQTFWAGIDPVRGMRVLLADRDVDAVLCVFENTALAILALRRVLRFKPPVFLLEVSNRGWRPRDLILDYVLPRIDQVLTLTTESKQYVESRYRLKRPAIVVGYWVDEEFFSPNTSRTTAPRVRDYILAVGEDHTRDFDLLLQACAALDIHVVIRTSRKLHISEAMRDRVEVIASRLSYRELRDLYRGARLVALPLRRADNPGGITTLVEAMSMAKPVICSETGATRDIVRDGINGILVPPSDVAAFRNAITGLLNDTARCTALGNEARLHIVREFSMWRYTERLAEAVKSTVMDLRLKPSGPLR